MIRINEKTRYVYMTKDRDGLRKIGHTGNPEKRMKKLSCEADALIPSSDSYWLENYLHIAFAHRRAMGEWFRLSDEEVSLIASIPHANRPSDLPASIIALHRVNLQRPHTRTTKTQKLDYAITIQCTEQDFRDVNEYIAKYLSVPRSRSYVALTALRQFIAASKEGKR